MALGPHRIEFEVLEGWGHLPEGWSYVEVAGVACDSRDRVYVFNRGACASTANGRRSAGAAAELLEGMGLQRRHAFHRSCLNDHLADIKIPAAIGPDAMGRDEVARL